MPAKPPGRKKIETKAESSINLGMEYFREFLVARPLPGGVFGLKTAVGHRVKSRCHEKFTSTERPSPYSTDSGDLLTITSSKTR